MSNKQSKIKVNVFENDYYELVISIEQAGFNKYLFTLNIMNIINQFSFPFIGNKRAMFFNTYKSHQKDINNIEHKRIIINVCFDKIIFLKNDDRYIIDETFAAIKRNVICTHFKDDKTKQPPIPYVINEAINMLGYNPMNPGQQIVLVNNNGKETDPLIKTSNKRKISLL